MHNDNNNKLSAFSFHKVQAMISEAPPNEVKSNTSQQDISDRSVSIFTRVKAMLTPSEMTKEKLKVLAVTMGAALIFVATNGLAIGALITIGILIQVGAFIALLLAVPVMPSSVVSSVHVAILFYLRGNPESDKEPNTAHILKKYSQVSHNPRYVKCKRT